MTVLYVFVALAVVFAIAAVVVGREARRLDAQAPRATFDVDEATEWVANHLPFAITAALSFEDVRRILEWNLEFLRAKGMSATEGRVRSNEILVRREDVSRYVLERAAAAGATFSDDQVEAVLDAQFGYFDAIGAIGPEVGPDERPER